MVEEYEEPIEDECQGVRVPFTPGRAFGGSKNLLMKQQNYSTGKPLKNIEEYN